MLSYESENKLKSLLQDGNLHANTKDYLKIIHDLRVETAKLRNKGESTVKDVCKRSLVRLEKKHNIITRMAENGTTAREESCASLRNIVSMAAMNDGIVNGYGVHPSLILNMDGTQYTVGTNKSSTEIKFITRNSSKSLKTVPTDGEKGIVCFFIKFYLLISAFGYSSDPVFVLQDSNMEKDSIDVHRVEELGMTNTINTCGYVVFCKTRCCNELFYVWYLQCIVIAWAITNCQKHNLGADALCWFQLDGEAVQIECFKHPAVIEMLYENHLAIGKPPGSSTEITQPCDTGNCFRGSKASLKTISSEDVADNYYMLKSLRDMYDVHCHKMLNGDISKLGCSNTSPQRYMAIKGLLRVQLALQIGINIKTIKSSFKKCGIYPYSLTRMFSNCTTPLTKNQEISITSNMSDIVKRMMKQGELFEKDFDDFGVPVDKSGKSKDHLVINRRRSLLLTNSVFIAREDNKMKAKQIAEEEKLVKKRAAGKIIKEKPAKKQKLAKGIVVPYAAQLQVLTRVEV